MEVDWEAAAWLSEGDGRRLQKLQRISGGTANLKDDSALTLTPSSAEAPEGGCGTGRSWCELCARAMCALRSGEEIELPGMLDSNEANGQDNLGFTLMDVPSSVPKQSVSGKDGSKLRDMCDGSDVIAVFTWSRTKEDAASGGDSKDFKTGDTVEAKYGNSWFAAEVLEPPADQGGKVKLKWNFDGSEAEVDVSDVQKKEAASEDSSAVSYKVGDTVEGKYGNSWFAAEVTEEPSEAGGKIKVKWGFDGSEAELDPADIRQKETASKQDDSREFKTGDIVEGKYGNSWFEAEVLTSKDPDGKLTVKWAFNDDEADLDVATELRFKDGADAGKDSTQSEAAEPPHKLLILGGLRSRLEVEVRVLHRIEGKEPGHAAANPRSSDETPGIGLSVMKMKASGGMGRLIGKGGSVKKRTEKVTNSSIEYMGKTDPIFSYIVGSGEERTRAVAVLELLQSGVDFRVKATEAPPELMDVATSLTVPGSAAGVLSGKKALQPEAIEEDTDTHIFALAKTECGDAPKSNFEKDQVVECKSKGAWLEATVLEISNWTADSDDEDETDGRTLTLKFTKDGKQAVVPVSSVRERLDAPEAAERDRKLQQAAERHLIVVGQDAALRRTAKLQLAASIEAEFPGTFASGTSSAAEDDCVAACSTTLKSSEASCLDGDAGKQLLRRLGVAANCTMMVLDSKLLCAGSSLDDCNRGQAFAKPLLSSPPNATEADAIEDASNTLIPKDKQQNLPDRVLGPASEELGVVAFFDDGASLAGVEDSVRLMVLCSDSSKREAAIARFHELQEVEPPPEEKQEWNEWKEDEWKEDEWKDDKKDDWSADADKKRKWEDDDNKGWESDKHQKKDWEEKSWKEEKKDSWDNKKEDDWNQKKSWDDKKGWEKKEEWGQKSSWDSKNEWDSKDSGSSWKNDQKWESKDNKQSWDKKDAWDSKQSWNDKSEQKDDRKWNDKKDSWNEKKDWGGKQEWGEQKQDNDWGSSKKTWNESKDDKWGKKDSWEDSKQQDKSWDKKGNDGWGQSQDKDWGKRKDDSWANSGDRGNQGWNRSGSSQSGGQQEEDTWGAKKRRVDAAPTSAPRPTFRQAGGAVRASSASTTSRQGAYAQQMQTQVFGGNQAAPPWQRPAVSSSSSVRSIQRPMHKEYEEPPETDAGMTDPKSVLDTMEMPDSIDEWKDAQDIVWAGHAALPRGWIRVWSRRHDCEYYLRLEDNYATFEMSEVM
eukprot:TRINITY_DN2344_c0_g1_i6.p1 TRINITY_DN2344_c0_g1~~TRINITY_DN2344_c0_g1_i6.p1  ORF type:complete len:1424 (+),score=490.71 TRINITY_DN2344_c0_g1_i6:622-4272(+)